MILKPSTVELVLDTIHRALAPLGALKVEFFDEPSRGEFLFRASWKEMSGAIYKTEARISALAREVDVPEIVRELSRLAKVSPSSETFDPIFPTTERDLIAVLLHERTSVARYKGRVIVVNSAILPFEVVKANGEYVAFALQFSEAKSTTPAKNS